MNEVCDLTLEVDGILYKVPIMFTDSEMGFENNYADYGFMDSHYMRRPTDLKITLSGHSYGDLTRVQR